MGWLQSSQIQRALISRAFNVPPAKMHQLILADTSIFLCDKLNTLDPACQDVLRHFAMKKMVAFRLPEELLAQLRDAATGPYAPSQTKIVERGIELALRELRRKQRD